MIVLIKNVTNGGGVCSAHSQVFEVQYFTLWWGLSKFSFDFLLLDCILDFQRPISQCEIYTIKQNSLFLNSFRHLILKDL